jgi:S1-C subfamily serine protease
MADQTQILILDLVRATDTKVDALVEDVASLVEKDKSVRGRIGRMEKVFLALFAAALIAGLSGCSMFKFPTAPTTPEAPKVDILARVMKNTLSLERTGDPDPFCSGVAAEGVFMTAAHCVEGEPTFWVRYQGELHPGIVTYRFEGHDLAFIDAVGARVRDTVPMTEWEPQYGQKVIWTGYPTVDLTMGFGIVASPSSDTEWAKGLLAVYGQLIPGNSGGPVFDETGKLLGIGSRVLRYDDHFTHITYIVPPHVIKEALESL